MARLAPFTFAALTLLTASISASFAAPPSTQPAPGAYPLTTCVISGDKLGVDGQGDIVEKIDGREVHFCCKDCIAEFKKNLDASNKKMDAMIVDAQKDKYALTTCPISGEDLKSMGTAVMYVYRPTNQLVEFCCKNCVKDFEKDPAPTLAKLAAK